MIPATCPDARTWQAILDDDGDAAEWQPHLETCARCQNTLQSLAADEASWADAAHRLQQTGAAVGDPGLLRVMERARRQEALGATEAEQPGDDELPPTFFRPADKPGLLGYLGHYEVLEAIGRGGMGVVFKAFDPALHRMAAVKVLAPQMAGSATARRRFLREGRNAAAVTHDHIVTIYDVDEYEGIPYLVMQYVAGMSLQEKLDREGPPPLADVLRIGMQTAAGLAAAHAQGLIHRDIKPANILLENGVQRVKITDFGLARAVDDASCTRSGVVAGTPAYMAPEQARGEPPDPRADLFSLGSVLYALCTGQPPYRGGSSLAVLRRVADEPPPCVRALNSDVPEWLQEIVSKLHATDPARRFGSAAEVADLLERHLAHLQQPAANPMPARLTDLPPAPRRPRLRRWLCAAAAVLLALGLAFGASEASGVTQVVQAVATALRITTPDGTLVVETDDPDVKVKVDGEDVVITGAGVQEVRVKAGQHHFQAVKDGVPVRDELVSISRGGKEVVKVSLEGKSAEGAPPPDAGSRPASGGVPETSLTFPTGAAEGLSCGALSPDGKTLVTCCWDGSTKIWDAASGKERKTIRGLTRTPRTVVVSPDNQMFAVAADDKVIRLYDLDSGEPRATLAGHVAVIHALAFSPDGKTLASAGGDEHLHLAGELKLWDLSMGKERKLIAPFDRPVWDLAYAPDGKRVAVALGNGTVQVVDATTGKAEAVFPHPQYARRIAYSPDGRTLAVAYGDDGFVTLWDLETRKERYTFQAHAEGRRGPLLDMAFGPGGKQLVTCGNDGPAMVWNVGKTQAQEAFTLTGYEGKSWFAVFSPDGRMVVTGGDDRIVRFWKLNAPD